MLRKLFAFLVPVLLAAGLLAFTVPSGAATLRCVSTESCGGATLAYTAKGPLSLAVLDPAPSTNGGFGYWNEPVGVNTTGLSGGSEDFTVFQLTGETTGRGGLYGYGEYVVMYTPGGLLPDDPAVTGQQAGSQTAYCVSVQDVYRTVRGHLVQRWGLVLRNCDAVGRWGSAVFTRGIAATSTTAEQAAVVENPDPYQLWAPVETVGPSLEFQDVALNSAGYRHGGGGQNFVMDDTALGGAGTAGIAFPENDQLNQRWSIDGCTRPVTVFNTAYFNCPAGPAPAPTVTVTSP